MHHSGPRPGPVRFVRLAEAAEESRGSSRIRPADTSGARLLRQIAITAGIIGVVGLVTLAAVGSNGVRAALAGATVAALLGAVIAGSLWALTVPDGSEQVTRATRRHSDRGGRREGRAVAVAVGLVTVGAVQTWFTWGRSLAGGDIAPPEGTAWIAHLFSPWAWTGSNLGSPNASATQLPWAVVLEVVHLLGGPAWLAQRLWLTLLFAGAALAALALLRTVGIRPLAAGAGALVYVLNPYVVSNVGINDVYLAAMILLAGYPAAVLAAASGRLSKHAALLAIAAGVPLLGFAYKNPPLAAMVAVVTALSAVVAGWIWGRAALRRAGIVLVAGSLLAGALSAYWIVPSLLQVSADATGKLSTLGAWGWTEGRANLANGLWLNTTWGWKFPIYYPYAPAYRRFPLDALKYLLAVLAFSALPLALVAPGRSTARHRQRLGLAATGGALFLVVLGTGTTSPGSALFDPLYRLPYGWLLREPGRFLMAAGLGYAVLVAITLEVCGPASAAMLKRGDLHRRPLSRRQHRLGAGSGSAPNWRATFVASAVFLAALVPAYPLALGQVASTHRRGIYPSTRVAFPSYWTAMASYINHRAPAGNLLVLPVDDFYQMPYRWGYYGNDGFITDLVARHVLDPSAQGYQTLSAELGRAVSAVSAALSDRQWLLADRLLAALGTPEILVRGDILASFPGRSIVSPRLLAARLRSDPSMRVVHRTGPLTLFEDIAVASTPPTPTTKVATVNTTTPDLRVLAQLPTGTNLVSRPLSAGLPGVIQMPGLAHWRLSGGRLVTEAATPPGWHYRLVEMGMPSGADRAPTGGARRKGPGLPPGVVDIHMPGHQELAMNVGRNEVSNGSFARGPWQPQVGNCNDVTGKNVGRTVTGTVLAGAGPAGTPALRLSASVDSACESTGLRWSGGPLLLSMWVRNVDGAPPRICVWEAARRRCAAGTPVLPASAKWTYVKTVLTPNPAAGPLQLYAYADALTASQVTVNEYADIAAHPVPAIGQLAFLATPDRALPHELRVADSTYTGTWSAPGGRHVLVDGMRNGWLFGAGKAPEGPIRFALARLDHDADLLSLIAALVACGLATMVATRTTGRSHHGPADWGTSAPERDIP